VNDDKEVNGGHPSRYSHSESSMKSTNAQRFSIVKTKLRQFCDDLECILMPAFILPDL